MVPVGHVQEWGYESTQISDSIKRVCFHPKLNKGTIDTPYHLKKNIHGILRIFVVSMKRSTKQFARALVSSARVLDNTDRAPNFVGRAFSPTENVHRAPHQNVSWIYGYCMYNNTVAFKDYSSGRFFPSPGTAGTQDDHVLSRLQRAIPA
ncbi:hypothetical protein V1477_007922 [Vespula maculifrons]|uniref:Uncharacterized protein n=1 Tax=Vespula maculifrons TaxID=7453 RepID=A0ABD2CGA1_VESMC